MSPSKAEQEFYSELDDAIDNLFGPYSGDNEKTGKTVSGGPKPGSAARQATDPKPATVSPAPAPASETTADRRPAVPEEIYNLEEALLSLDWEISQTNIDLTRLALKNIQASLDPERAENLAELFTTMEDILDSMAVASQIVPTTAPKAMQEGMEAIKATMIAEDPGAGAHNMVVLALAKLRAVAPYILKDDDLVAEREEREEPEEQPETPQQPAPEAISPAPRPAVASPVSSGAISPRLAEAIGSHLNILEKCIAKRILPMERLFGKNQGYEKLHAIHADLRKRLERQREILTQALDEARRQIGPGSSATDDPAPGANRSPGASPWKVLATTTWNGQTVAFVPDQIAFQGVAPKGATGPYFPLKNLAGLFGKIKAKVTGDLAHHPESVLKTMAVPMAADGAEGRAAKQAPIVLLFKENSGTAFRVETPIELLQVTPQWRWLPENNPDSMVAGKLSKGDQTVRVITIRTPSL
ncbi:MAG TPA: hypothetical protein ENN98_00020 [Desulfurivibrio alkaliphilus]|uniref:Uncharacterized protein n=1 Tax=Desulfurivibrio alkaliphilus TaxID=427923 RepID=A0A7C2XMP3_9BACT|nr:hypothetical protein [Desulfurivibrio alkaliphilus]